MNSTTVKSISKIHAHVNKERSDAYSNYENLNINWSSPDSYQLVKRVGRGKYSDVFLAVDVRADVDVIIKVLKPVRKRKIRREIKILENLRGHPNIINLLDCTLSERGIPSLVFDYINCPDFFKYSSHVTLSDLQFYFRDLAKALSFAHSNGIIHRDVKPQNIIVDFKRRILKLIDWGLAEFYFPYMAYNVRVASRYYKSPELLIDYQYYDYSLDVWSFGCVLGGLIFQKEPLFHGLDNRDQLVKIVNVFGTSQLKSYLAKYQHTLHKDLANLVEGHVGTTFGPLIQNSNKHLAVPSAISLCKMCLTLDHAERPTADEILKHEFFSQEFKPNFPPIDICY